jgi:hypothetical protein
MVTEQQIKITHEARREALAMARAYPIIKVEKYSLRLYYWSLAQSLRELEYGLDDPYDIAAFTCYGGLDFDEALQLRFKEVWAKDIGKAGGLIASLVSDIELMFDYK